MRFYSFVLLSAFIVVTVARAELESNNSGSIFPTLDDSSTANHSQVSDPQQLRINAILPHDENRVRPLGAALKSLFDVDKHLFWLLPRRMIRWVRKEKPADKTYLSPPKAVDAIFIYVKLVSEKYPEKGDLSAAGDMYKELKKHFHDRQLASMFYTAAEVPELETAAKNLQDVQINFWLEKNLTMKKLYDYLGVKQKCPKGRVDGPRLAWRAYAKAYNNIHVTSPVNIPSEANV
uniref:RxLR effector protein n=1 Tax=Peronospora matthiolae TaxID=2874970 RepID=A0AAV1UJJ2_9STRA